MRDTSSDFPSSTLSSKDSGVSTLSNKKSKNSFESEVEAEGSSPGPGPELRERSGPPAPRPVTIAAPGTSVTSAPNLLVLNRAKAKPRMPDPEPELHVNRIHVSSAPVPAPSATNSVYMNVPKHPEYVNYADSKHQYVNVPETNQPSTPKRKPSIELLPLSNFPVKNIRHSDKYFIHSFLEPLPKPRLAAAPSPGPGPVTPGEVGGQSSDLHLAPGHRGKRPVPLPRRLSSVSSPASPHHSAAPSHVAAPITPSPSPISGGSSQSSSPSHFFARSRESSAKKPSAVPPAASVSTSTPGRRKGSASDVPTPTANFKSYRRVPPKQKQPAPPAPPSAKLKSVTRLSFDSAPAPPGQSRRADSGLGHSSISSADSVSRLSSVSSTESGPAISSPVRILVKQEPARPRRPSSQYYEQ